jgi:hypothetical protein
MRVVFEKWEQMRAWLKAIDKSKYWCYITSDNEIILRPVVDPKARDYAYLKLHQITDEMKAELEPMPIFYCKSYDWKLDTLVREV